MNILILLVGGNPIANFAIIEYFKNYGDDIIPKFDKVVLVSTSKMKETTKRIIALQENISFVIIDLEDKENKLQFITKKVSEKLIELHPNNIHLNYTGGRKPMSIGTYLAVKEYKNPDCKKIYSDICPVNYILTFEDDTNYPNEGTISSKLKIPLKDFYLLHGLSDPKFKSINSVFYSKTFCQFLLKQNIESEEDFFEKLWDKEFKELKKLPYKNSLKSFLQKDISLEELKKLQDFIKGIWLEEYIFNILKENQEDFVITDLAWDIQSKNKDKDFQLDVIAICGYRSYLFTCTTEKRKEGLLKNKAFEAASRSHQLGGIESKTILVCLANENIIENIKNDMNHMKKKFDIIGVEILKKEEKIVSKLKEIFNDR